MDELPEGMDPDERELILKLRALTMPYVNKIQAEPWKSALHKELQERAEAIIFEYELRKYLPDCNLK